jgi:hypothetical protein
MTPTAGACSQLESRVELPVRRPPLFFKARFPICQALRDRDLHNHYNKTHKTVIIIQLGFRPYG